MTEPLDDARGELLEHIAEIIRDEVRITADGIIYNSTDVAKIILNRAAPARGDADNAVPSQIELALEREEKYLHDLIDDEAVGSVMHGDLEGAFMRLNTALAMTPEQIAADKTLIGVPPPSEAGRLRLALEEIKREYVEAPGWAAPTPTTELIWKMYSLARAALSTDPGTVAVASADREAGK